jgi:hypothetical protein
MDRQVSASVILEFTSNWVCIKLPSEFSGLYGFVLIFFSWLVDLRKRVPQTCDKSGHSAIFCCFLNLKSDRQTVHFSTVARAGVLKSDFRRYR